MLTYGRGITEWGDLNDADFVWLLLDSTYTATCDDQFIDDISFAELTDGSYSRVVLSGSSLVFDQVSCLWVLDCDDPTFPLLAGATVAASLVLARDVTTDADSPLLAHWSVLHTPDGNDFTPTVSTAGLAWLATYIGSLVERAE